MGLYIIDFIEPTNFSCRHCVGFKNLLCKCKRIDDEKLSFYKPWFLSDSWDTHMICSDFYPNPIFVEPYIEYHRYKNFEELFNSWKTFWGKQCFNNTLSFFINKNKDVSYQVKTKDFIYGTMIENNKLKVVSKQYFKRAKKSPYGYTLITKPISDLIEL